MKNLMVNLMVLAVVTIGWTASAWVLYDDFSGSEVDTSKWNITEVAPTSSVSIVGGRLYLDSPWYSSSAPGHGAFVTMTQTFSLADSTEAGVMKIAYDAEMGPNMSRPYGHQATVSTVDGDTMRAHNLFYGGTGSTEKQIYLDGRAEGWEGGIPPNTWVARNFQSVPLHIQVTMSVDGTSFKIFNHLADATPDDYTATVPNINNTDPGSLIASQQLVSSFDGVNEELYLLLAGTTATTAGGRGQIYFDNVYTTIIPEPSTLALLGLAGVLLMRRRRR